MQQPSLSPGQPTYSRYQVGDLVVDVGQARVSREGTELPLPKLSFDLLVTLIETAPNVVTVDALMERVWPGLVVSPETVSQRIKLLRDALGDDAKQPRYIAGVRGRGYRFIAPVAAADEDDSTRRTELAQPVKRRSTAWLLIAGLMLVAIAIIIVVQRRSSTEPQTASRFEKSAPIADRRSIAVLPFDNLSDSDENDVLALGISETLLHRLSSLRQITVTARTSSFAFRGTGEDAREIGRKLNVRYLLEGSVQSEGQKLRVTAQLIDASTRAHVWSMQFDRTRGDIFAVQDEIALQVARALEVTLDPRLTEQLTGQGTNDFEAYLAFMQARALSATLRMDDLRTAVSHLERSIERDPRFASAYVLLAGTQLLLAEYEISQDRQARFEEALERGYSLIDKAVELDATNADAYVQRGYLDAFSDLAAAEAAYRRGLELQPNNARAYEGLASVLFEDIRRIGEAEQMLNRARELDPLEPRYDVTHSTLLLYGRSDCGGADRILKSALVKNPLYQPALMRIAEVQWVCFGRFADSIVYGEQALALDPRSEWTRQVLGRAYLDLNDSAAAEAVLGGPPASLRELPVLIRKSEWALAAKRAYRGIEEATFTGLDEAFLSIAIRKHARLTGDYQRAIKAFEKWSAVTWSPAGTPLLTRRFGLRTAEVGLADMLLQSGDQQRGHALLESLLVEIDREASDLGRGEFWNSDARLLSLTLLGQTEAALSYLERSLETGRGFQGWWRRLESDAAYDQLRADERFTSSLAKARAHAAAENARLQRLRADGRIPDRSKRSN